MKKNIFLKKTILSIPIALSIGIAHAQNVTVSDLGRDINHNCIYDGVDFNKWGSVDNTGNNNALVSCYGDKYNEYYQPNTEDLSYSSSNLSNIGCGTEISAFDLTGGNVSVNQFDSFKHCLFALPGGNEGQNVSIINQNTKHLTCRGEFTCQNSGDWQLDNVEANDDGKTVFCDSENVVINNPYYNRGFIIDTRFTTNKDPDDNTPNGQRQIKIPNLAPLSSSQDMGNDSISEPYHYEYTSNGYRIRHIFECVRETMTIENTQEPIVEKTCSANDLPDNFTVQGVSQHPYNPDRTRPIKCIIPTTGANIEDTNPESELFFEASGLNSSAENSSDLSFYLSDADAIFYNNFTYGEAQIHCENGQWQIYDSSCSNIRNMGNSCINSRSEKPITSEVRENFMQSYDDSLRLDKNPHLIKQIDKSTVEKRLGFTFETQRMGCYENGGTTGSN